VNRQQKAVYDALRSGRRLTFLEAATDQEIGCAALSQRCGELRRIYGIPIDFDWVTTSTGARIKCYFLRESVAA
jgi:hypothetical protein